MIDQCAGLRISQPVALRHIDYRAGTTEAFFKSLITAGEQFLIISVTWVHHRLFEQLRDLVGKLCEQGWFGQLDEIPAVLPDRIDIKSHIVNRGIDLIVASLAGLPKVHSNFRSPSLNRVIDMLAKRGSGVIIPHVAQ